MYNFVGGGLPIQLW